MSVVDVLRYVEEELARHGAEIISVSDLAALRAVEAHLSHTDVSDVDMVRPVAWVASLTPTANRDAFRNTFGDKAASLLDALVLEKATSNVVPEFGRTRLRTKWAEAAASEDADLRVIATALLASEAEKVSTPRDRDELHQVIKMAERKVRDEKTKAVLAGIHRRLEDVLKQDGSVEVEPTRPLLISLSIDVVGSTEAKRRLRDLGTDGVWRSELYRRFYADFLHKEGRFYAALFEPGPWGRGPPLDWRRLFVVKGIGDELWLLYEPPRAEDTCEEAALVQSAVRLIAAAMELCQSCVSCGGTGEDTGSVFDPAVEEKQRHDWMELPFKISIDLVQDAIEISGQRLDYLAGQTSAYLAPPQDGADLQRREQLGASHVDLLRRLNAGHFELSGGHMLRQAYRTDYIGPDVDRFFRITKFALPGLVMVGDNLMKRLRLDIQEKLTCGIEQIQLLFPADLERPESNVSANEPILRMQRRIAPNELKGISDAYIIHHLVGIPALRDLLAGVERNSFLEPTVAALPPNIRELIRPKPVTGA